MCNPTDKSGRMSVSSRDNYTQQGATHVAKDEPATWRQDEEAKTEISNHYKAIINMFRMGED